jgi:hypothetical protein
MGGNVLSGAQRPTILAVALPVLYSVKLSSPKNRFFGLAALPLLHLAAITVVVAPRALSLRFAWRTYLLDRCLGLEMRPPTLSRRTHCTSRANMPLDHHAPPSPPHDGRFVSWHARARR